MTDAKTYTQTEEAADVQRNDVPQDESSQAFDEAEAYSVVGDVDEAHTESEDSPEEGEVDPEKERLKYLKQEKTDKPYWYVVYTYSGDNGHKVLVWRLPLLRGLKHIVR